MTYNTTLLESISERAGLVPLNPLGGEASLRKIYVVPKIADLINSHDVETAFPHRLADLVIGRYLKGHCVWICLTREEHPKTDVDLKRLENADEIWNFRFAKRSTRYNGWRVFGRFLGSDFFVGLVAVSRDKFRYQSDWDLHIDETKKRWSNYFPTTEPFRSASVSDYVSGYIKDVTQSDD